jgi:hypothetical protein
MYLVSIIIIVALLLTIKTFINDIFHDIPNNVPILPLFMSKKCDDDNIGKFSNNILVDLAGVRENYGLTSLSTGINYRGGVIRYSNLYDNDGDNDEGDGSGNFTNRPYPDVRYLEDTMDNNCWTDICMKNSCSNKFVGTKCKTRCSVNPNKGYQRTFGNNVLIFNNNISDPLFKSIQYKDKKIYIPWSDSYNNIVE